MPPSSRSDAARFVRERDQVLVALISPLVHGANNALAVVQGALTLGAHVHPLEATAAQDATDRVSALLRRLTLFSKSPPAAEGPVSLTDVMDSLGDLLVPLAATGGIELRVEPGPSGSCAVLDGPRLTQALVVYLGAWIAGRQAAGRGARGRATLRRGRRGYVLALTLDLSSHEERAPAALQRLRELAAAPGCQLRLRDFGAARRLRFSIAGSAAAVESASAEASAARTGARRLGRLLYFAPEGEARELYAQVLREHGFAVTLRSDPPTEALRSGAQDALLFDGQLERERPGFLAAIEARGEGLDLPLGILGRHPLPGAHSHPELSQPARPRELLAFVTGLLRPRTRKPF